MIHDGVLILKPEKVHIDPSARVDSLTKIEGGEYVYIGKGTHISSFVHLNIGGGSLHIGNYVAITSGAKIHSGTNDAAGRSMSSAAPAEMQVVKRGETRIEDYAFIGSGAQVLMGVTVGEYAVVGAGAVVTKDVPSYTVWFGVPAKMVGRRVRLSNGRLAIAYFAKGPELAELMEAMYP